MKQFLTLLTFFTLCLNTKSLIAAEYKFTEFYYGFGQSKHLNVKWAGEPYVNCASESPTWIGWNNRKFHLTLRKAGIQQGFGQRIINTNDNYGYEILSTQSMPLVVGQDYTLLLQYYGQDSSSGGCFGNNQIRDVELKLFTYDKHDTILQFPVDINVHSRMLRSKSTAKCLLPDQLNSAYETLIGAANCNGNSKLAFEIINAGTSFSNEVRIWSQMLRQCLSPVTPFDGSEVRAGSCLDDRKTIFVLDNVRDDETGNIIPGEYRLRHKDSGKCLYNYEVTDTAHVWACWNDPGMTFTFEEF